jgi:hypothetical protein
MSPFAHRKVMSVLSYLGERPAPMVRKALQPLAFNGIFFVVERS